MKMADKLKLLGKVGKFVCKGLGWQSSQGFIFTKKKKLFFSLIIVPTSEGKLFINLLYKWFEFDDLFWDIVDLPENKALPLSFHAAGAWVAPMMKIYEKTLEVLDWDEVTITMLLKKELQETEDLSLKLAEKITTPDENLNYLKQLLSELLKKYPGALTDIGIQTVLTFLLKKEYKQALDFINKKGQNTIGPFTVIDSFGSKSFYDQAANFSLKKMQ